MNDKKKPHRWAKGRNQRNFETPHSTRSINYWLNQYSSDGILFVRTSLMLMYWQQTAGERSGHGSSGRNGRGFSASTRNLVKLAKKCCNNQQLTYGELNEAREKLAKHLGQLKKLWNRRYDRRKAA